MSVGKKRVSQRRPGRQTAWYFDKRVFLFHGNPFHLPAGCNAKDFGLPPTGILQRRDCLLGVAGVTGDDDERSFVDISGKKIVPADRNRDADFIRKIGAEQVSADCRTAEAADDDVAVLSISET